MVLVYRSSALPSIVVMCHSSSGHLALIYTTYFILDSCLSSVEICVEFKFVLLYSSYNTLYRVLHKFETIGEQSYLLKYAKYKEGKVADQVFPISGFVNFYQERAITVPRLFTLSTVGSYAMLPCSHDSERGICFERRERGR
jgi:hypothetical protein